MASCRIVPRIRYDMSSCKHLRMKMIGWHPKGPYNPNAWLMSAVCNFSAFIRVRTGIGLSYLMFIGYVTWWVFTELKFLENCSAVFPLCSSLFFQVKTGSWSATWRSRSGTRGLGSLGSKKDLYSMQVVCLRCVAVCSWHWSSDSYHRVHIGCDELSV